MKYFFHYFRGAKSKGPNSDPCFLIRDEIFFHYFSGAKSKGPTFGSFVFKHRFLFTISAERKARVQNSDPCFLKKDKVFFPLLPREAKSKGPKFGPLLSEKGLFHALFHHFG